VDRACAQTITNLTVSKNGGNSPDQLMTGDDAYQNKTTVTIQSSSATGFTARYAETVGADIDSAPPSMRSNSQNTDYTIQFDVTAPGGYYLTVETLLSGAFTLVDDGSNGSAAAEMSPVAGSQTGGILASGTLNLPDPGGLTGTTGGDVGFNPSATARIDGTSNGSPVTHRITFTWTASCQSDGILPVTPGDECAVRLGLPTEYTTDTAGDYPGPGNRDQNGDGHFVQVALTSLCGNGIVDPGENCDDGGTANGDCCSSSCLFDSSTSVCRASAGPCDVAEHCTGASATCPANAFQPSTLQCRAAAGPCDVAEFCTGTSAPCPADVKSTALCRAPVGPCDAAESCDGAGNTCPPDALEPTTHVCRGPAGPCDAPERCSGTGIDCPPDALEPSTVVCRAATGACDVAESCTGGSIACPADGRAAAGSVCRPALDACDVPESCDGTGADCPPEFGEHDSDGDGVCDTIDGCPGTSDPDQSDSDVDGIGDACDPCTNVFHVALAKPRFVVSGLLTPPGDDRLSFKSMLRLPVPLSPPIDPMSKGARVLLVSRSGTTILDAPIPGGRYGAASGAGWKVMGGGRAWLYRNNGLGSPTIRGIRRLLVKLGVSPARATIRVTVTGFDGSYPVDVNDLPVKATVVIDSPLARGGQCGERSFTLPPCSYDARKGKLRCRR
jgi:cysteine-rich repeat protein